MKKKLMFGALIAGALMFGAGTAAPAMAATNLITNGSFSSPTLAVSTLYNAGTSISGWSVDTANGYQVQSGLYIERAPGGEQSGNVMGAISQSFPTEVGKTYTVLYSLFPGKSQQDPLPLGNVPLTVRVTNGTQVDAVQNVNSPATGAVGTTFSFTASGTTTKISFSNPYMAVGLDSISVTEVPVDDSPIMIPAIAGGLGVAALAAGSVHLLGRKNKRASA
ncbi:hypothetical protein GCM10022381_18190 [Leifsonia kafniensis]|uniref:DUF642 domain-containing protein n=1 Tax=Leifsonia kafniensis TaxID=475957 RepID=A0ABP7KFL7_9MICO